MLGVAATVRAQAPAPTTLYCSSCDGGRYDAVSRLCLPAKVEGARVTGPAKGKRDLKAYRNSLTAGYDAMRNRLAVTVSLFDRERATSESDDEEMRVAVREVLDMHRDATLEMGGLTSLPVAGEPWEAQGAWLSWSEGMSDYVSLVWLLPRGERWMKVRATYVRPQENTGEAAEFALEFVRSVTNSICLVR